jgi:hypothetical protein
MQDEAGGIERQFDVADRYRTEQLRRSGENVCVMGVGVEGDDVVDRHETRHAVLLDRKPSGDSTAWPTGPGLWRVGSLSAGRFATVCIAACWPSSGTMMCVGG